MPYAMVVSSSRCIGYVDAFGAGLMDIDVTDAEVVDGVAGELLAFWSGQVRTRSGDLAREVVQSTFRSQRVMSSAGCGSRRQG